MKIDSGPLLINNHANFATEIWKTGYEADSLTLNELPQFGYKFLQITLNCSYKVLNLLNCLETFLNSEFFNSCRQDSHNLNMFSYKTCFLPL